MNDTALKESHRSNTVRMAIRFVLIGCVIFVIANLAWFSYLKLTISRVDHAFSAVKVGDHSSRVRELMGSPDHVEQDEETMFLSLLPEDKKDDCTLSILIQKQYLQDILSADQLARVL